MSAIALAETLSSSFRKPLTEIQDSKSSSNNFKIKQHMNKSSIVGNEKSIKAGVKKIASKSNNNVFPPQRANTINPPGHSSVSSYQSCNISSNTSLELVARRFLF